MAESIKNKIMGSTMILIFLAIFFSGLFSYILVSGYVKKNTIAELRYVSEYEAQKIDALVAHKKALLKLIADQSHVSHTSHELDSEVLKKYFSEFWSEFPGLGYVNKKGQEIVKVVYGRSIEVLGERDELAEKVLAQGKGVAVSPIFFDSMLNLPVIEFLVPEFCAEEGDYIGSVTGMVSLLDLFAEPISKKIRERGFMIFVDRNGNEIIPDGNEIGFLKKLTWDPESNKKMIDDIYSLNPGSAEAVVFGKREFIYYYPIKSLDVMILTVLPYSEFISAPNALKNLYLIVFIIVMCIAALVTFLISRGITLPLQRLSLATDLVAKGDLSIRADIQSDDEVGKLGKAFNLMLDDLQKFQRIIASRPYIELIMDSMIDPLFVASPEGKIRMCNRAARDISGYSEDELPGKMISEIIADELFDKQTLHVMVEMKEFVLGRTTTLITKKGEYIPLLMSCSGIKTEGGEYGEIVVSAKDIRQLKDAEEQQRLLISHLARVNAELDSFNFIVSHSLKEPLRSISAYSTFLIQEFSSADDEKCREYCQRLRENVNWLKQMVEDFLRISAIEKNSGEVESIDSKSIVNEAMFNLTTLIKESGAKITISDGLPRVSCNRGLMVEVFIALISNACKFSDKTPVKVEIGCSENSSYYEFFVKDNGPGIAEHYFESIFKLFQRLEKKERYSGTGAGLAIAKKIILLHQGKIWVKSKVGEGSVFYFTIPKDEKLVIKRKKIGEILVEKNVVSQKDLNKALNDQGIGSDLF